MLNKIYLILAFLNISFNFIYGHFALGDQIFNSINMPRKSNQNAIETCDGETRGVFF